MKEYNSSPNEPEQTNEPPISYGINRLKDLRAVFFEEANAILDNGNMLEKAKDYIHQLRQKQIDAQHLKPYTMHELNERIDEAKAEEGGTPAKDVFTALEQKFPFLCK